MTDVESFGAGAPDAEPVGAGAVRASPSAEMDENMFRRLVLANQYDMLAVLDRGSADHYHRLAEMLREWWPLEVARPIAEMAEAREDPLTGEEVALVLDILQLYQLLQDGEDKGYKLDRRDRRGMCSLDFPGFDGNEEGNLYGFYLYTREEHWFSSLRVVNRRDANSHWPFAGNYRRLVAKWDELGRPTVDEAQFHAITGAWAEGWRTTGGDSFR